MHKLFLILTLFGLAATVRAETKTAIFAGGCFWCMQEPFDQVKGVTNTVVGYTGGSKEDANYTAVSAHKTEHREAIEITYDPAQVSYDQLLNVFWHNINPTQADGQFHDIGLSYQAAIYYGNDVEKKTCRSVKGKARQVGQVRSADRDRDSAGQAFLSGRRLSPKILPEESGSLRSLSHWFRARQLLGEHLGKS